MGEVARSEGRHVFGDNPRLYDDARPGYPERVFSWLRERCELGPATRAFEIGPGTGQATKPLLDAGVGSMLALEPDARLAAFLRAEVGGRANGRLTIRTEAFEDAVLPAGGFDLGVAATSYHWLDPRIAPAKIAAAIRPGGWWAMWWNVYWDPKAPDAFDRATRHLFVDLPATPSASSNTNSRAFAFAVDERRGELLRAGFTVVEHERMRWRRSFDARRLQALYATFSHIALLPAEAKAAFLRELGQVVDEDFGGRVERTIHTSMYLAQRAASG